MRNTRIALDRQKALRKEGLAPEADYDAAQANYDSARASVEQAAAAVKQAETDLKYTKIVALGVVASAWLGISGFPFYATVALAMGAGGVIGGLRVTETLARRITPMSPTEGFSANLVTTLLVGAASLAALPVSTTHVSSSAIIGIGLHRGARTVDWRTVREMLFAWIVTLPVAGLVGAGAYALLARVS